MEETTVRIETRKATTASRVASWLAVVGGVVVATLLAGVGVAAVLARQGGSDNHTDATVVGSMRFLFSNPIMRIYWHAAKSGRDLLDPESTEAAFAQRIDKICAEYENLLARNGRKSAPGPTLVPDRSDPAQAA